MTASITCMRCRRTSHHPRDVEDGYCANCHGQTSICAHCGRRIGDDAGGYGSAVIDGRRVSLCHPSDPGRPDCYRQVTGWPQRPLGELVARGLLRTAGRPRTTHFYGDDCPGGHPCTGCGTALYTAESEGVCAYCRLVNLGRDAGEGAGR